MKTSHISLTIGWIGAIEDLKVVDPSKLLTIHRENQGIEFDHRFFEVDVDEIPRKSDGPDAVGLDIEVWVSEGQNPRPQYPFELFVYHRCPELPGHAKDWDELFEQVKRGIWIKLHPQEFQEEIIQALGRERLKELHRKSFVPEYLNLLKDLSGSAPDAPKCKICGHDTARVGATYQCGNCGEEAS